MRKIDKGYAIIYIDDEGESLKHEDRDYEFGELGNEYYKTPGDIQWNYYLIVPTKYFTTPEQLDDFLENDKYTRKYAIKEEEIDSFILGLFPDLHDKHGKIELIKGDDWRDARDKAQKFCKENPEYISIPSYYREHNMMFSLSEMDGLRAELIYNSNKRYVFYTHITNEIHIAEKKFKLFINQKDING